MQQQHLRQQQQQQHQQQQHQKPYAFATLFLSWLESLVFLFFVSSVVFLGPST